MGDQEVCAQGLVRYDLVYQVYLSPSKKVREDLADVISIHSSQLACPNTVPVLVLHTEAKVLLLSQNGTVRSDWSASHAY